MPSIDESIRKIDNVICRHLDEIENNSRGAISQDILEQLTKFVNHVMLKFYAKGADLPVTEDLGNRIARLPFYTSLADEGLDYTIENMKKVLVDMYGF